MMVLCLVIAVIGIPSEIFQDKAILEALKERPYCTSRVRGALPYYLLNVILRSPLTLH